MIVTDFTPNFKAKLEIAGFRKMDKSDKMAFADAPDNTLMVDTNKVCILIAPDPNGIHVEALYYCHIGDQATANLMWYGDEYVSMITKDPRKFVHDLLLAMSTDDFLKIANRFKPTQKLR